MGRKKVKYSPKLRAHVKTFQLRDKLASIFSLLGDDAQNVVYWATDEAKRRRDEDNENTDLGALIFNLIAREAAVRLVQENHARGRLTTKSEIRKKTGLKVEMPVIYREAGLRHPQEARNLRHNIFHDAFHSYILKLFPDVATSVPTTGTGLTPDLIVEHKNPDWLISVEYKGYRSISLLSESEVLKAMRYQEAYGTAWLVTTTTKTVRDLYGPKLHSKDVIESGLIRLKRILKKPTYTNEQRENRGIARKGIKHLEKQHDLDIRCNLISAEDLIASCQNGTPLKGLSITTGFEFADLLRSEGFNDHANEVLRIMKTPTYALYSDKVTSMRLIE